ncbi:YicC family protein [Candidatus Dependentiae bacterium]|nr:YicC family protein [Candidatus Dependentiae bacterium]
MIQSMTGFASGTLEIATSKTEKLSLIIQLKSLNSRYFELTCKLPYLLNTIEVAVHKLLKKSLERGHVYIAIRIQQDQTKHVVIPAINTIKQYLQAIETIKKSCGIKEEITLATLLQLPNILQVEEEILNTKIEEKILQEIEKIITKLKEMRFKEGKILAQDIKNSIKEISKNLKLIKKNSEKAFKEKKEKLDQILKKLQTFDNSDNSVEKTILDQQKINLLSEIEKIDINEELVRAEMHCKHIDQLVDEKSESHGKKLDFTLQELNRETNTIASKCNHSTISSLTINIKTAIEKAREQAQNIV